MDGLRIGGTVVKNLRYADDTVMISESEEQFQSLKKDIIRTEQNPSQLCSKFTSYHNMRYQRTSINHGTMYCRLSIYKIYLLLLQDVRRRW